MDANRTNSFKTFENTKYQAFNERIHFEIGFEKYLASQPKTYPKVSIQGRELDVFVLFHLVLQQGGLEEVNRKGWPQVLRAMGIDPNPTNQASVVGYYTACMQSLENSVKGTLNSKLAAFGQSQGQQGQNQNQYYASQGYTQPQQFSNQFSQNQQQQSHPKNSIFPNQIQPQAIRPNQAFSHGNNQYQNPGLSQYQSPAGMGYLGQNQSYGQMQAYPNQVYSAQGFPQSYGQGFGQGQGLSDGQGFNKQQPSSFVQPQQSPRQVPNQLSGQSVYSQQGQQGFNGKQVQSQYYNQQTQGLTQAQKFSNQLSQSQQYPSNQVNTQSMGFSPQVFQGQGQSQSQPQSQMRQQPSPQQFQGYASQLQSQPFSNLMFNQISNSMQQQPFLSSLSVPGQGVPPTTPVGSVQSILPQMSPSALSMSGLPTIGQQGMSMSVQPSAQPIRRYSNPQQKPPANISNSMSALSPSASQPQTDLQFLDTMFSNIQKQGPETTQSPAPSIKSPHSANNGGFASPVIANSPVVKPNDINPAPSSAGGHQKASGNMKIQSPVAIAPKPVAESAKIVPPSADVSKPPILVKSPPVVTNPVSVKQKSPVQVKMEVDEKQDEQTQESDEELPESGAEKDEKDANVKEEVPKIDDKQPNDPSRRSVTTVGGIEFQSVVPYLTRPRATKKIYCKQI
jgi:hypothetical protein